MDRLQINTSHGKKSYFSNGNESVMNINAYNNYYKENKMNNDHVIYEDIEESNKDFDEEMDALDS
jgi:hypothetical protein